VNTKKEKGLVKQNSRMSKISHASANTPWAEDHSDSHSGTLSDDDDEDDFVCVPLSNLNAQKT